MPLEKRLVIIGFNSTIIHTNNEQLDGVKMMHALHLKWIITHDEHFYDHSRG